ncbi:MAG: CDP-diacylglycerol--glycerol-3-phosphate 3-phosphatidyltransferase, partial [Mollicutes bacterium]|nr:CDP-diacylglycerol--glycerol-3-phosphate 3-phosphatidyltransferase [Mollicutes bacterium]
MNLANKFTFVRIIFTLIIIFILLFPFYQINIEFPKYMINNLIIIDLKYIIAGILFVLAAFTDFLDGYIARKYNMVTDFGKFMDQIADKILVNSVLIILAASNHISAIIPVLIIMRDTVVSSIRMITA